MARSATISATTTMPAMPAVVHVAGSASTSTLPATQARSAAKITRAQACGRVSREATQAQSAPKAITPRPSSSKTMARSRPATETGACGGQPANGPAKIASTAPETTEKTALPHRVRRSRRSDEAFMTSSLGCTNAPEVASPRRLQQLRAR